MSIQQKQQLLVKEIIEKGYNVEAFQKFIDEQHSLEDWDYDELVETIKKFQDQQHDYFQVLKCPKTQPNAISQLENLIVTIPGYEKVQKGIFLTTHVYFKIETKPINWIVKRQYDEFIAFKNILSKHFYVPNIPNQRKSPVEFTYIKQLRHLQMFLNYIIQEKEIRSLPITQEFLSADNFTTNQSVQFSSLTGDVGVRINKTITNFIKQSDFFLNNTMPAQKKAYKLIKQLMKQMQQQNQTMTQLSDVYKELFRESKAQNTRLKEAFKITNNLFDQWSKIQNEQIRMINETIYSQQRFQYNQLLPIRDLINHREKAQLHYYEFAQKLKQKKEKLFQQGEVIKWDLDESYLDSFKLDQIKSSPQIAFQCMCKNENAQLMHLQNQYGQINLKSFETIENVINYASFHIKESLEKMCKLISPTLESQVSLWSNTLNSLMQL